MTKQVFFTVVFVLLTSLSVLHAATITVCSSCEITSIKDAIEIAKDFDTILVKSGTYKEHNIHVNKPLKIIGEKNVTIDGELKGEIFTVTSDDVTIDGLRIINVGTSYTTDFAAIRIKRTKNFVIQNMILEKLFFGIYVERGRNGKILNNTITGDAIEEYNSGNGIQLWYSEHIDIKNNTIQQVRDGIYLEFSNFCNIENNISTRNIRYGLHFMFSNNDLYRNNTFESNGAGVAVMFSKELKMYDNVFKNNWGMAAYGLLLKEINDADIRGNTFLENTTGINVEGSNRITYVNNNFISNGWAVNVKGACYANHFESNNFLYNSFDVSYNSRLNDNYFDKNYWSDYTGYDLDKDGIGDIPYRPVKLFSYIVNRSPETIILLRSLFIDIIDFSEKVSPVFTPDNLLDNNPKMRKVEW